MNKKNILRFASLRKSTKSDVILIFRIFISNKTPLYIKILIVLMIWYILSPIDIIPDWIPIIGIIDDVTLTILFIKLIKKLIPQNIIRELNETIIINK